MRFGHCISELEATVTAAGLPWDEWKGPTKAYIAGVRKTLLRTPGRQFRPRRRPAAELRLEELVQTAKRPIMSALEDIPPSLPKAEVAAAHLLADDREELVFPDLIDALSASAPASSLASLSSDARF